MKAQLIFSHGDVIEGKLIFNWDLYERVWIFVSSDSILSSRLVSKSRFKDDESALDDFKRYGQIIGDFK